ncbi:MAG: LysE family translocator, partial [Anaerolineales bacterium]
MSDSLLSVLIPWFIVSIGAVVSPGPVSAAVISEAPRQGWRVGPLVSVGHSILELILVVLLGIGLSAGLASPPIQRAIAFVGGLVLLAMGAGYLLAAGRGTMRLPDPDAAAPRRTPMRLVGLGILMTASNPFWYAWWVTVAAAYLAQVRAFGGAAVAAFYLG